MITALTIICALLLDALLGEPRRWHPLVGFGGLAERVEQRLNQPLSRSRLAGLVALLLLITPFILAAALLDNLSPFIGLLLLYLALGGRSLIEHAQQIANSLKQNDLKRSRQQVGWIVSRETGAMQPSDVTRATIESVLENGSDAIFGALFWFLLAGAPGVVAYRLVNTLDAMWGYRNSRFQHFGWAAARLDDLLNWAPARLTAITYALVGSFQQALHCWSQQAALCDSPNAGPVMAAGAGALNIRLGGASIYQGKTHQRPILGSGSEPEISDIARAIKLVRHSLLLWAVVIIIGGWFFA
jgi:adenosylcobinamide-phosphate synthase